MPVKRVTPAEAVEMLGKGYKYVDVRSIPEFQGGHPPGAFNIPLNHMIPGRGMGPNPDFERVFAKHFGKDDKLILGCGSGPRSLRAGELLLAAGYVDVSDVRGGWNAWREGGLAVETSAPGRGWDELK